jgi:hypothetical protein
MSTPENTGSEPSAYPIEEIAPTLDLYCAEDRYQPVHVSNLTPDPAAEADLKLWARLHYQIRELRLYDDTLPSGVTPELTISADFPASGVFIPNVGSVTWIDLSLAGRLRGDSGVVEGWRSSYVKLDLKKPGLVEVTDTYIALPEAMPAASTLEAAKTTETTEGLYMADDGSSVAFKQEKYVLGNEGVERLIELLRGAQPLDDETEIAEQRWNETMAAMEPGLQEACHRYFVLGKNLLRNPEEAFREESWEWAPPPENSCFPLDRGLQPPALHLRKTDTYTVYVPPFYTKPFNWLLYDDVGDKELTWSRATWDERQLPDDYVPGYDKPTDVRDIGVEEAAAEIPLEQHATFAQLHVYWLSRIAGTIKGDPINRRPINLVSEQEYKELVEEYISAFPEFAQNNPPKKWRHWTEILGTTEETYERDFAIPEEPAD